MNIMELNYSVQVEERRKLVQIVSEIINTTAVYKKAPTCAYEIGTFTASKNGVLSWTEDTDAEMVKTVVAGLQMMGFNAKEEKSTVKKVMEQRSQPQPGAPKQPQEQRKDEPDKFCRDGGTECCESGTKQDHRRKACHAEDVPGNLIWKKIRERSAGCDGRQGVLLWQDINGCGKIKLEKTVHVSRVMKCHFHLHPASPE